MENKSQNIKTAAVLLTEYLNAMSAGDAKVTASYFAEDGYIDAPYVAALGMPSKMIGPETIEAVLNNLLTNAPDFHFKNIKIIMESPTEVVAEYESEGTLTNGREYKQLYMTHVVTKDGKIVSHTEFLNTVAFAQAMLPNGLRDLIVD